MSHISFGPFAQAANFARWLPAHISEACQQPKCEVINSGQLFRALPYREGRGVTYLCPFGESGAQQQSAVIQEGDGQQDLFLFSIFFVEPALIFIARGVRLSLSLADFFSSRILLTRETIAFHTFVSCEKKIRFTRGFDLFYLRSCRRVSTSYRFCLETNRGIFDTGPLQRYRHAIATAWC